MEVPFGAQPLTLHPRKDRGDAEQVHLTHLFFVLHGASHASSMHNLYTIGVHATVEFSDARSALMLQRQHNLRLCIVSCASEMQANCSKAAWASLIFGGADEDARETSWGVSGCASSHVHPRCNSSSLRRYGVHLTHLISPKAQGAFKGVKHTASAKNGRSKKWLGLASSF